MRQISESPMSYSAFGSRPEFEYRITNADKGDYTQGGGGTSYKKYDSPIIELPEEFIIFWRNGGFEVRLRTRRYTR